MRKPKNCPICGRGYKLKNKGNSYLRDEWECADHNYIFNNCVLSYNCIQDSSVIDDLNLKLEINNLLYDITWYPKLTDDIGEEIWICKPISASIPYFEPDFTNIPALIQKINNYIRFI